MTGSAAKAVLALVALVAAAGPLKAATADGIVLHPSQKGAQIHTAILGVNSSVRSDGAAAHVAMLAPFRAAGFAAGRWPGGSLSDRFDWQTTSLCDGRVKVEDPSGSFDSYMTNLAQPAGLDVEITVNYGTSGWPACDKPGDPGVAAAWVRYANKTKSYGIKWWEIGNEVYGPWETDAHQDKHSPVTYSSETAAFYAKMKAEDPTIKVGVPVTGGDKYGNWDAYVLAHAKFDYVAYHFYPERSPNENDDALLAAPQSLAKIVGTIRSELAAAGKPNAPISISEWNSVPDLVGKQSVSIVNGLFAAESLGEMLSLGIDRAEFWSDYGCFQSQKVNMSPSLYGWQDFGSQGTFSPGVPTLKPVMCHWSRQTVPYGKLFPPGRAFQLYAKTGFVSEGERMVAVTSASRYDVRAYAASHGRGYSLMLINLEKDTAVTLPVSVDGLTKGSGYTWLRYGKAEYDQTRNNGPWVEPVSGAGGPWAGSFVAVLPPWSMTIYTISP